MSKQNIIEEPAKIVTTLETVEMNVAVGEGMRRLPVYLLLDTSGSMAGAPIQALRLGVEQFKKEVAEDPFAKESVYMGVITFGGEALYVTKGLVSFEDFAKIHFSVSMSCDTTKNLRWMGYYRHWYIW